MNTISCVFWIEVQDIKGNGIFPSRVEFLNSLQQYDYTYFVQIQIQIYISYLVEVPSAVFVFLETLEVQNLKKLILKKIFKLEKRHLKKLNFLALVTPGVPKDLIW